MLQGRDEREFNALPPEVVGFRGPGYTDDTRPDEDDMNDEKLIREVVERWALAAHEGEMDAVLGDHAPDIVMFDVPPPNEGVRGIDAYNSFPDNSPPEAADQSA